jgi:hypothetical protein
MICVMLRLNVDLIVVEMENVGSLVRHDAEVCASVLGSCRRYSHGLEVVARHRVWVMGCEVLSVFCCYEISRNVSPYLPYRPLGEARRSRFGGGDAASRLSIGVTSRLLLGGNEFLSLSLSLLGEGTYLESPPLKDAGLLALYLSSSRRGENALLVGGDLALSRLLSLYPSLYLSSLGSGLLERLRNESARGGVRERGLARTDVGGM